MQIHVNGQATEVPDALTVDQLLHFLGMDGGRVAVERNARVARRAEWASTPIQAGDQIEVLTFVGGG